MTIITPMRAADLKGNIAPVERHYPVWVSVKLDGYRATTQDSAVLSKNNKPIPNGFVQQELTARKVYAGLDGELIVGAATGDPLQRTSSGVTTRSGEPDFTFHVFDDLTVVGLPFNKRIEVLRHRLAGGSLGRIQIVPQKLVRNAQELDSFEDWAVAAGYEGIMVRAFAGEYKQGGTEPRSTIPELYVAKLKRTEHFEAVVLSVYEQMANTNTATKDELGRTKRSTHKAGKIGKGVLGGCVVRGIGGRWDGVTFEVGVGWNDVQRAQLWTERAGVPGRIMKLQTGRTPKTFVKPQFPRWVDWKWEGDL